MTVCEQGWGREGGLAAWGITASVGPSGSQGTSLHMITAAWQGVWIMSTAPSVQAPTPHGTGTTLMGISNLLSLPSSHHDCNTWLVLASV